MLYYKRARRLTPLLFLHEEAMDAWREEHHLSRTQQGAVGDIIRPLIIGYSSSARETKSFGRGMELVVSLIIKHVARIRGLPIVSKGPLVLSKVYWHRYTLPCNQVPHMTLKTDAAGSRIAFRCR